MKNVLCIDSSTHEASIALFQNSKLVAEETSIVQRSHSEFVTSALQRILEKSKLLPKDLEMLAITIGPGSFTGVRVSVGLAKALGYSLNIPIWATHTMNVLRSQVPLSSRCFASLNAYKNLIFGAFFEAGVEDSSVGVYTYESIVNLLSEKSKAGALELIGEGTDLFVDLIKSQVESGLFKISTAARCPHARNIGEFFLRSPKCGQTLDWKLLNPLYLRGSEAEENLRIHSSENS